MMNDSYNEDELITARSFKIYVNISWSEKCNRKSLLTFWINRETNCIEYKQYVGVESDENCDRMKHLGLGKFIVDGNPNIKFF